MSASKPYKFLTIVGNIGSGKSSAAALISKAFKLPHIDADSLFQTVDPFAKRYLKDIPRWAFTNELWLTLNRAKLIEKQADPNKFTIVDSGLLMSWVFGFGHKQAGTMNASEWKFFSELYRHFAKDFWSKTLVIRLKYSTETLFKRIKKRGRDFELVYYTPEYLDQINRGLTALQKELKQAKVPMLVIDEKDIPDFMETKTGAKKLISQTKEFLKKKL